MAYLKFFSEFIMIIYTAFHGIFNQKNFKLLAWNLSRFEPRKHTLQCYLNSIICRHLVQNIHQKSEVDWNNIFLITPYPVKSTSDTVASHALGYDSYANNAYISIESALRDWEIQGIQRMCTFPHRLPTWTSSCTIGLPSAPSKSDFFFFFRRSTNFEEMRAFGRSLFWC